MTILVYCFSIFIISIKFLLVENTNILEFLNVCVFPIFIHKSIHFRVGFNVIYVHLCPPKL